MWLSAGISSRRDRCPNASPAWTPPTPTQAESDPSLSIEPKAISESNRARNVTRDIVKAGRSVDILPAVRRNDKQSTSDQPTKAWPGIVGSVVAITGSSRGIGAAIADAFAGQGALVVINSRHQRSADEAAVRLGRSAVGVGADVSTQAGATAVVQQAVDRFGRLDVMICNAGRNAVFDSVELTESDWRDVIGLNLDGVFFSAQAAGRVMLKQGGGSVIAIGSIAGRNAFPRRAAYNASKAAVEMLTKVLAIEWAPTVRVNCVAPGYVQTDLIEELRQTGRLDYPSLIRRTPMRRFGEPAEIADAALFLASEHSRYITGETLVVDGGWSAYGFV